MKAMEMLDPVELYVEIDDFSRKIYSELNQRGIGNGKRFEIYTPGLNLAEILTILILYHFSNHKCFKHYYLAKVYHNYKKYFPLLPSYNRFVERISEVSFLTALFLQYRLNKFPGNGFIDSTPLAVCTNKRTNSHQVFKCIASIGKSSKGWYYGLKLHVICDFYGNIVKCLVTTASEHDLKIAKELLDGMNGKIFADKGYIGKKEFIELLEQGLILVTSVRKNMKNRLLTLWDRILLKKRSLIESIFNIMKNVFEIEHSRHRSINNASVHILTVLVAYCLKPNKPQVRFTNSELQLIEQIDLLIN